MIAYLLKRLAAMLPTLLGITFVTFMIINLAPGDPVSTGLGQGGGDQPGASGDGGGKDRQADAIKAKKKLLGMVRELRAVQMWGADLVDPLALPEQASWARALTVHGDRVWAGGRDGDAWLQTRSADAPTVVFPGDGAAVEALAVSPDGAVLLVADEGGTVRAWPAGGGAALATRSLSTLPLRALTWLPDGSGALAAGDEGRVYALGWPDLVVERTWNASPTGVYAVTAHPDGQRFFTGGYDRALRMWDRQAAEPLVSLAFHTQAINAIAVSPDGARLATGCDDRKVRIFPIPRAGETTPPTEVIILEGHYKGVSAVAFVGPDQIVSGGQDETLRVWQASTGAQLAQADKSIGRVSDVAVGANGAIFTAADGWIEVPIWRRYIRWLGRIITFDFDRSFVDQRPVIDKIAEALPVTLGLNLVAIVLIYMVSIPIGVYAAVRRGTMFDHVSSVVLFILYSIPNFWLATLLIMFFSSKQNWDLLPSIGLQSPDPENLSYLQWLWDIVVHSTLPMVVMVYAGFASLSRYARTSLLETIQEDYVRTARAKGLSESVVVYKHAFRNSLITIVTLLGNLLPAMIGGSVIVEYIFTIEGMGKLGFDAILTRDYPVIMAITTFSAFLTLLGVLVSDLLYSVVDPRVQAE